MSIDWSPLRDELARWRSTNLTLPIWWRDDDAVADTPALERLVALADGLDLSVHIAVIPNLVTPTLAPMVAAQSCLIPVVHGWRHISHAPEGAKKAEFGHPRVQAGDELKRGRETLARYFGKRLVNLFVPPWNRIDPPFLPVLAKHGYAGVSTYGPRTAVYPASGLMQINTHIDPIFWRGHRGLVDPEILIDGIVTTLQDRRAGHIDASEPLGLLTHHLVHTEEVWNFTRDLLDVLLEGGALPADIACLLANARATA
ncbi:polysaccharide deacetylase family protein [Sulfitobacter sp. F26169L]|uniref:polysaccharide deacetylase family protein n=1 Tax=Sulfitobacter sp. F26169L TaxID=2996015 RepID=UPI002260E52E|nr:polysaccharide deacetylase family protein [Sulfitobacter sp. F26169L]MCX7567300.1 polysaccharide deacetylase family protein [Sulfitobacter sp. F26169L]